MISVARLVVLCYVLIDIFPSQFSRYFHDLFIIPKLCLLFELNFIIIRYIINVGITEKLESISDKNYYKMQKHSRNMSLFSNENPVSSFFF